jgi:hypothetical protein
VAQYHAMAQAGILGEDDPVELLEGYLVTKVTKNPGHSTAKGKLGDAILPLLPPGWLLRIEDPVTTRDSEPEPDMTVARGSRSDYTKQHPHPDDIVMVIEVADSSLRQEIIYGLERIYAYRGPLHRSAEAQALLKLSADEADNACYEQKGEFLQNYYGRKPDHIMKLSALFAVSNFRTQIERGDVELALAWINEIEPEMSKAFGFRSIEKDPDVQEQLINVIPYTHKITRGEVLKNLQNLGKQMPINGGWESNMKALALAGRIKRDLDGQEEWYQRIS